MFSHLALCTRAVHVRLLNYTTQLHISYQLVAKCTYIMQEKGNASFNLSLTIMPDIAGGGEVQFSARSGRRLRNPQRGGPRGASLHVPGQGGEAGRA